MISALRESKGKKVNLMKYVLEKAESHPLTRLQTHAIEHQRNEDTILPGGGSVLCFTLNKQLGVAIRPCSGAAASNAPSKRCLQSRHAVKMQAHLHQIRILLKIQMTISE